MLPIHLRTVCGCLAVLITALAGCAEGPIKADPAIVAELQSRFLLDEEPGEAVTPIDWRDQQSSADEETTPTGESSGTEPSDAPPANPAVVGSSDTVVLVGIVGGMPSPWADAEPDFPWRSNEATFFLVDPSTAAEFSDHADEAGDDHAADCPFCAREAAKNASSIVAVSFLGPDGKPTPIDARELLGLAEGDMVVVRGKISTLLDGELLVLEADGLYARN